MLVVRKTGYKQFCLKDYDKNGENIYVSKEIFETEKEAEDFLATLKEVEKEEVKETKKGKK